MRVLIVEDELRMASLIRRGLVTEGLAADVAPAGEDALWMAEAHDYDAIVLDVMLPGIDGFETCASAIQSASSPAGATSAASPSVTRPRRIRLAIRRSSSTISTRICRLSIRDMNER